MGKYCTAALAAGTKLAKLYAATPRRLNDVQASEVASMGMSSRPSPISIGSLRLPNPVVLAPMSGVTDAPFRRLAAKLGAGLVVSEMTASAKLVEGRNDARLRLEAPGVGLHVVQLAGCEAHWMSEGARIAEAAGADLIDINMGGPAR